MQSLVEGSDMMYMIGMRSTLVRIRWHIYAFLLHYVGAYVSLPCRVDASSLDGSLSFKSISSL